MISKTKYKPEPEKIREVFRLAGFEEPDSVKPLGAGEYNAVYSVFSKGREYVLKIAPLPRIENLTYERDIMLAELFWYEQMRSHTSIRVPEIYFTDFSCKTLDSPYFIMEKIQGCQLDKMKLTRSERADVSARLCEAAAQIHKIKNDGFGYVQNEMYDNWYDALKSFIKNCVDDRSKKTGKISRKGNLLLKYAEIFKKTLTDAECTMVNYDMWAPNVICERKNGKIEFAFIDPERSFWGDPVCDFICLEPATFDLTRKKASLAAYNAAADRPLGDEESVRFYFALGYLGLISETEKYYRYTVFHFGWWRNLFLSIVYFRKCFSGLKKAAKISD